MTKIFPEDLAPRFSTRAIHAGQRPDPTSGAIMPPIMQTSTYAQDGLGVNKGYEYARGKNPTREALERNIAALEGGQHGFAFSSGMGCLDSIMKLFKSGDHIIVGANVYGGTFRLFDKLLQNFGLEFSWIDTRDPQRIADAFKKNTRAVMLETPTNPLMHLTDIRAAAEIAKGKGALTIVDNTFATPYFQRPLDLGADIVWHSSTKYLNGHSDLIGGVAVVNDDDLAARLQFILNSAGAVPGPFDAWLTLRGTKTLALRMRQHDTNGRTVALWLAEKVGEKSVFYPGLSSHPQHELAKRQMASGSTLVAFEVNGGREAAFKLSDSLAVILISNNLGDAKSLISHPATTTHQRLTEEQRAHLGISPGLVRLSVGLEDAEDIKEDIAQALDQALDQAAKS